MTVAVFIIAWLCTLAGDFFLSVTQTHLTLGIALFCIVQTMYMLYLKPTPRELAFRVIIFVSMTGILALIGMFSMQNVLAVFDIVMLGANAVKAWKEKEDKMLFAVGLSLFFCCDICVGLRSILPYSCSSLMLVLIWSFYLPSQVLIFIYGIRTMKSGKGK
ncbi:MAG: lysoplasmalogenase family protein [Lachnospiraceae bacterium]|nr:lysoplasmalogenase family protein [Lachnospiraceae bacterium]